MRVKVKVGDAHMVREFRDDEYYGHALWDYHLATRGWALQDNLVALAPSTLDNGGLQAKY